MILISGGTGLLGSHLIYELLKSGKELLALKRPSSNLEEVKNVFSYYPQGEVLFEKIKWVDGDMLNYDDVLDAMDGVTEVYHCAAIVSFESSKRTLMIKSNTSGTANMVNAALVKKVRKFLHVSSTSAIGKAPEEKLSDETMIWSEGRYNSGYSISKFSSEMEVWRGIEEGLNAVIVNPSIILGPGFWDRGSSSIFTTIDKGMKFYANGITGYVGVWDVTEAMVMLMNADISKERFLISSENHTYKHIFDMVADALGKRKPPIEATKFMGALAWRLDMLKGLFSDSGHTFTKEKVKASRSVTRYDNKKVRKTLNFEFEGIEEVIGRIAEYYKSK